MTGVFMNKKSIRVMYTKSKFDVVMIRQILVQLDLCINIYIDIYRSGSPGFGSGARLLGFRVITI